MASAVDMGCTRLITYSDAVAALCAAESHSKIPKLLCSTTPHIIWPVHNGLLHTNNTKMVAAKDPIPVARVGVEDATAHHFVRCRPLACTVFKL